MKPAALWLLSLVVCALAVHAFGLTAAGALFLAAAVVTIAADLALDTWNR